MPPEQGVLELDDAARAQPRDLCDVRRGRCGHVHAVPAPGDVPTLVAAQPDVRMLHRDLPPQLAFRHCEHVTPERLDRTLRVLPHAAQATESWKTARNQGFSAK